MNQLVDSQSVTVYVSKCVNEGLSSTEQITTHARNEVNTIENRLIQLENEINLLRSKKNLALQVLKSLHAELDSEDNKLPIISGSALLFDLTNEQTKLVVDFCNFLESSWSSGKNVLPSHLMDGLNIKLENDVIIYSLIKWLGVQGIITKTNTNHILRGDNWYKRPK